MRKLTLTFSLLALLALPATALAHENHGHKNDVKTCKSARTAKAGHGVGKCVSAKARLKRQARRLAVKTCREERAQDPQAFADNYGEHPFRNCVKQGVVEAKALLRGAATDCRDERAADEEAFADKYGTNANKRNAFGKCVSQSVRQHQTEGDDEGDDDGADDEDSPGQADENVPDDAGDDAPDDAPNDVPGDGPDGEQGGPPDLV
jgi:hypothetical protein